MSLLNSAKAWHDQDPDPHTREELSKLIASNDQAALESRFGSRLQFGTAGLRGELGAGPNRMNRVVVAQAAAAIASFLNSNKETYRTPNGELVAVIGYDGRINSDVFAFDSASILQAAGINTYLFDSAVPTPVAAFTGKKLSASVTIVVTASHNPPRDNGYKVYLGGPTGNSQLVSPQDAEIAKLIDAISQKLTFDQIPKDLGFSKLGQGAIDDYVNRAIELLPRENPARSALKITYTAMHGVGHRIVKQLFHSVGFKFDSVSDQQEPDGTFPTVAFPNPEEPGAMDLSFETAKTFNSDLILANDPDADRLAVGVLHNGNYQMLTGDQVGLILAEVVSSKNKTGTIANSIVSQSLEALAKAQGVRYQQTLTGFKWISKVPRLSFGYEEALGYCVDPSFTPDKDGITAALLIAELAADEHAKGKTLIDYLGELAAKYGHNLTTQVSIRVTDLSIIAKIMETLRNQPPAEILGLECEFEDLALGKNLPKTDGLLLSNDVYRVIIRPSGTEPKLKCYLQVVGVNAQDAIDKLDQIRNWAKDLLAKSQ